MEVEVEVDDSTPRLSWYSLAIAPKSNQNIYTGDQKVADEELKVSIKKAKHSRIRI